MRDPGTGLGNDTPRIKTRFIGFDETDIEVKYKDVTRSRRPTALSGDFLRREVEPLFDGGHSSAHRLDSSFLL